MNTSVAEPLQQHVIEPLQHVIDNIHMPSVQRPSMQIPDVVSDHLPDRFRPERHRSRKPLLLLVLVVIAAVAAARFARRNQASGEVSTTYNGSTASGSGEPSFVDVR